MRKTLLHLVAVSLCGSVGAGELLPNGIRLPDVWPPMCVSATNYMPTHVPYLEPANIPNPIPVDGGRQLFVDDFLVEGMTGLTREWGKPVKYAGNPVMTPKTPLERNAGGNAACALKGGGVWWDDARKVYRMWYESGWLSAITYAESKDGIRWTRPNVGVVAGSNRLIAADDYRPDSWSVICDPDADASERWKMFVRRPCHDYTEAERKWPSARKWTSADGIRWKAAGDCGYVGDRSTLFYNPFRKVWVFSQRSAWRKEQTWWYRTRSYCERKEFNGLCKWDYNECEPATRDCPFWMAEDCLDLPDPAIGDRPQVYNFDAVAYETLFVGIIEMLKGPGNLKCERAGLPKVTDLVFCYSRDGFHFSRPNRAPAIASERWASGKWDAGYVQPCSSICIVTPEKLRFYYSAFAGETSRTNSVPGKDTSEHPWWKDNGMYANGAIGFAEMRRDGFAGVKPTDAFGVLVTRPVVFSGRKLFVNADARAGTCRVEVLSENGKEVLKTLVLEGRDTVKSCLGDVGAFAKRKVRLRFALDRATLYSFWISPYETGESGGYLGAGGPGYASLRDCPSVR